MKLNEILKYPFYQQSKKMLLVILGCIFACKISFGAFGLVIIGACLQATQTNKPAKAFICFSMIPFLTVLNPMVFGLGGLLGTCAKLGMPVMALAMLASSGQRKGQKALPILGLMIYVVASIPGSMFGYAPIISFMKMVNFVFFVLGIYAGVKNLDRQPKELEQLRAFFFAFCFFIVVGSMLLHFISGGAHAGTATLRESINTAGGGSGFLCGVVNHSQCLGPTTAIIAGWVLSDMLFVEKNYMPLHSLVLALCPVVLYLTQSRTSLLSFVFVLGVITIYCMPKFRVPAKLKQRIGAMLRTGLVLLVVAAAVVQVSTGGMKKWLNKHSKEGEEVTVDSLTASRQGLIEESLYDFRLNPFVGKGFQVSYTYQEMNTGGSFVLSAPIEKGFILTTVLGEAGVLGGLAFLTFLIMFWMGCQKYLITLALFSTFLVTNLGEATLFSPGGTGGPEWIISAAGGFVLDLLIEVQRRNPKGMPKKVKVLRRIPVVRWWVPTSEELAGPGPMMGKRGV